MRNIQLKQALNSILKAKQAEVTALVNRGEEFSVKHSILLEEIEDVKAILESLKGNTDGVVEAVHNIKNSTTSATLYNVCTNYLINQ